MKDIDIVGIASGLLTRIFEYPPEKFNALERRFGFERNGFCWLPFLPPSDPKEVRGTCFSTVEESLIIAAHFSSRQHTKVLFAKCGTDAEGVEFTRLINDYGIRYETPPAPVWPTFATHIYVAPGDKEPTIVALNGGASDQLTIRDIKEDAIRRSQFLLADAYNISLPVLQETTTYASQLAHRHDTKVVYGLGRHEVIRDNRDKIELYIDTCQPDLINGNQFEFRELLFHDPNKHITDEELGRAAQTYIISKKIGVAVITFAERGSQVVSHHEIITIEAYTVPEREIIDKACAGTAFMGAFLEARCRGKDYTEAGAWGSYAASQTLKQYGLKADWKIPPEYSS